MRTTLRSVVAAAAVAGLMALGAGAAQAHSGDNVKINKESYEVEIEVGDVFAPEANVNKSEFVMIDQSATAIITEVTFGDMVFD